MAHNDDLALQLVELRLRIETLQRAFDGNVPLSSSERAELQAAIDTLRTRAAALEEELRGSAPGGRNAG